MVDRIDQKMNTPYWAINSKNKPQHDGEKREHKQKGQEFQDEFDGKKNLQALLKENPQYQQVDIHQGEVSSFTFKGLVKQSSGASLEVDINFKTGHVEKGVKIAVGQEHAFGFMKMNHGENIALEQLFLGSSYLSVGVALNSHSIKEADLELIKPNKSWFSSNRIAFFFFLALFLAILMGLIRVVLL